jgi:hypothetical protein
VKEAGSNLKTRIINYENFSLRNMDEKMILGNPKFTSLDKIDPKYILGIVEQAYGPRVQQIHRPTYKRRFPDYINIMYLYPTNFRFLEFTLFNGQELISALEHIARFICQCREVIDSEFLKLRLFPNSLIENACIWYMNLPLSSVQN